MARTSKFKVVDARPKGWRVNVPKLYSETGKRCQRFFDTREKANEFASGLREKSKEFGVQARNLSPAVTGDALAAIEILKGFEVTLVQCAKAYVKQHDRRTNAPTLSNAWEKGLERRKNRRDRTIYNLKSFRKRLPQDFVDQNIVDLTSAIIREALIEITNGETAFNTGLRLISSILGDYVKEGILHENPCCRVPQIRVRSSDEVKIYTVEQVEDLFSACRDYPEGKDRNCKACALPFAFLAFAGLRPKELTRLKWENVYLESNSIRIGGSISKTGKTRNVRIQPTLKAWIETIPECDRKGKIIPSRWIEKAARVKREAKLDGRELQDALRHSFGSYLLGAENDLATLRADMGHKHEDTFFDHYHNAVTKEKALPYWNLKPI